MANPNLNPTNLQDIILKVSMNKPLNPEEREAVIRCLGYQIPKKPTRVGHRYICSKCDSVLPVGSIYCNCGYKVGWEDTPAVMSAGLTDADIADKILEFCWDYDKAAYAECYGNYNDLADRTGAVASVISKLLDTKNRLAYAKEIFSVLASTRFSELWEEPDTRLDAVSIVDGLLKPVVEETCLSDGTEDALFCFLWTKIRTIFMRVYVPNGYCFVVPRGEDSVVVYPYVHKDKLTFNFKKDSLPFSEKESSFEELLKVLV